MESRYWLLYMSFMEGHQGYSHCFQQQFCVPLYEKMLVRVWVYTYIVHCYITHLLRHSFDIAVPLSHHVWRPTCQKAAHAGRCFKTLFTLWRTIFMAEFNAFYPWNNSGLLNWLNGNFDLRNVNHQFPSICTPCRSRRQRVWLRRCDNRLPDPLYNSESLKNVFLQENFWP